MAKRKKIRVGVLFGGRSPEHEVSLVSGASVIKNLDQSKYQVVPIGISKGGQWLVGKAALDILKGGCRISGKWRGVLLPEPSERQIVAVTKPRQVLQQVDVVFPVLHGSLGEDGTIQGLLELADVPYVGPGVLGSSVCMDKIIQKMICNQIGLPVVRFLSVTYNDYHKNSGNFIKSCRLLSFPLFVKPANAGSSVGISKVHNRTELIKALVIAFKYDRRVIVEEAVKDPLEIECAVLGNDLPQASVLGQVIPSNEFYDYDAKYVDGKSQVIIPAPLSQKVSDTIRRYAVLAFKALDLAGMARLDFLVERKTYRIYLNEVNTIPGFTSISMYPKLWQATGLSYSKLLDKLVSLALARYRDKSRIRTSFTPNAQWYQ